MLREILVPVDGSEGSAKAARFAAYLARETGAALTLIHVYDAPAVAAMGLASLSAAEMEKAKQDVAKGSFDHADVATAAFGVETSYHVVIGHPAYEIVAMAREKRPQLIVMGHRGLSPVQELVLGSVSDYVMRHAPCPVTVVR